MREAPSIPVRPHTRDFPRVRHVAAGVEVSVIDEKGGRSRHASVAVEPASTEAPVRGSRHSSVAAENGKEDPKEDAAAAPAASIPAATAPAGAAPSAAEAN